MMTKRTLQPALILLFLLALPFPTRAQSDEIQFADITVDDAFVISLPADWLIWQRAAYATDEEASEAASDMIAGVAGSAAISQPVVAPWDRLIAIPPTPVEGGLIRLTVEIEQIDALASRAGLVAANVAPARLLDLAGAEHLSVVDINGRYVAFGRLQEAPGPALIATYVFRGHNRAVVVSLLAPTGWLADNLQLVAALLGSLRLVGEPVDIQAFELLAEAPYPAHFILPPGSLPAETDIAASEAPPLGVCGDRPAEIAFTSARDGNYEIYLLVEGDPEPRRLTENPGADIAASWSPDGSRLFFHSDRNGNMDIFSMNADGSDVQQITATDEDELAPSVSPDGTRIAFHRVYEPGQSSIHVLDLASGTEQRLTVTRGMAQWPAWSPDGSQIAFNADFSGALDIHVMNADGSKVTRLTRDTTPDGPPVWSPDGSKILFWAEREHGRSEAYVMNADGSDVRQLTYNRTTDFVASWSPDGRYIALESDRGGNPDIYILEPNERRFVRLTDHDADDIDPRWRPCAAG